MRRRCPAAKPLKPYALPDFRLVFRGVADIIPAKGKQVHGVLWSITAACEKSLDRYEGYYPENPKVGLYRKESFKIQLPSGPREVMYYTMNRVGFAEPSESYGMCIEMAYDYWDLPESEFWTAITHAQRESSRSFA